MIKHIQTQTCKQEYASAGHIEPCKGFKKRMKIYLSLQISIYLIINLFDNVIMESLNYLIIWLCNYLIIGKYFVQLAQVVSQTSWFCPIQYTNWPREGVKKKNGLFSDIDHISFNTHPPPPKNDIWQKWLSVGKLTTHPPSRNNDIFLNKRCFREVILAGKFQWK